MTKDEALKLALEALDNDSDSDAAWHQRLDAKTAIIEALASPVQEPVQDSTCNETLRGQGKAYPRTCKKCGLGPCIGAPKQPPAQPAPVQERPQNCGTGYCSCIECVMESPPQRTWVGLTDKEAMQICVDCGCLSEDWLVLLDAIEAKLKEKNS